MSLTFDYTPIPLFAAQVGLLKLDCVINKISNLVVTCWDVCLDNFRCRLI